MNTYTILNLILLLFLLVGLIVYLVIKVFFTREYANLEVPLINSSASVISSKDLNQMIQYFLQKWDLSDYKVVFRDQKFLNVGLGIKKRKKEIVIASCLFSSVGYEIDYILSHVWFSAKIIKKDRLIRNYSLVANYLITTAIVLYFVFFALHLILFVAMVAIGPDSVTNTFIKFIWEIPIIAILGFFMIAMTISLVFFLMQRKQRVELMYTQDTLTSISKDFISYRDDFRIARQYSNQIRIAYNFAFHSNDNDSQIPFRWLGTFVRY